MYPSGLVLTKFDTYNLYLSTCPACYIKKSDGQDFALLTTMTLQQFRVVKLNLKV